MQALELEHQLQQRLSAWDALWARLGDFVQSLRAEMLARRTHAELSGLSDHMLADIGLRRDQIAPFSRRVSGL